MSDAVLSNLLSLRRQGAYQQARRVARDVVVGAADPDPRLVVEHGRLEEEFAAYGAAEAALVPLVGSGDAEVRARASTRLVAVRRGQGRLREAAADALRAVSAADEANLVDVTCEALVTAAPAVHDVAGAEAASRLVARAVDLARGQVEGEPSEDERADGVRALVAVAVGSDHRRAGRWDDAAEALGGAIGLTEAAFGPHSLELANALNELGVTFKFSGRFDEARQLYGRCLLILTDAFGSEEHPDVASVYHNLGGLAHARGDLTDAVGAARRGLAIRERALGNAHLAVALDRAALASILDGLQQHDEAETLLRGALPALEQEFGPEHHEVAVTLNNLAAIAQRRGDLAAAEALYRRALVIKEKTLGPNASETGYTVNNLAVLRRKQGDLDGAEALYRRALSILEASLEPTHPSIQITLENLARVLDATGRNEEAARLRAQAATPQG